GRIATSIVLDFAGDWLRRVPGIAARAQRRFVQEAATIEMQDKYRRFGRDGIDFIQRWHPTFGKLKLAPAPDDSDPLSGRGALDLFLEHAQGVSEGRNSVPSQLQVIGQSAADDVCMRV